MLWSTAKFKDLLQQSIASKLSKPKLIGYISSVIKPLQDIYEDTLYKMQHNGTTIYLEKVLNEHFEIAGYDRMHHETTKKIYIDDVPVPDKLYIHLDAETDVEFLEDVDSDDDLFLDAEDENIVAFSFIIFIPETVPFEEYKVRNLVDYYRYFGKKYMIQTYTL